jgi:hypothetical protein
VDYGAAQLLAQERRFLVGCFGARDLGDDGTTRGDPDALTAASALEIRRQVLPEIGDVHFGHDCSRVGDQLYT